MITTVTDKRKTRHDVTVTEYADQARIRTEDTRGRTL